MARTRCPAIWARLWLERKVAVMELNLIRVHGLHEKGVRLGSGLLGRRCYRLRFSASVAHMVEALRFVRAIRGEVAFLAAPVAGPLVPWLYTLFAVLNGVALCPAVGAYRYVVSIRFALATFLLALALGLAPFALRSVQFPWVIGSIGWLLVGQ